MRSYPDHEHNGYTIAIKVWPAPGNRYQSEYSVHCPSGTAHPLPPGVAVQFHTAHREGRESGASCETEAESRQDAIDRARAWIDVNPIKE